ncbi:MAG: hypothetical protein GXP45_06265 [bacterium]|nr:hypothetical protein [bacterium]
MSNYAMQYEKTEKKILSKFGVDNFYNLTHIDLQDRDISKLVKEVKELTYHFSIYARAAFFFA